MPDTKTLTQPTGQLSRAGISPELNYGEVQSGESRRDFYPQKNSQENYKSIRRGESLILVLKSFFYNK